AEQGTGDARGVQPAEPDRRLGDGAGAPQRGVLGGQRLRHAVGGQLGGGLAGRFGQRRRVPGDRRRLAARRLTATTGGHGHFPLISDSMVSISPCQEAANLATPSSSSTLTTSS